MSIITNIDFNIGDTVYYYELMYDNDPLEPRKSIASKIVIGKMVVDRIIINECQIIVMAENDVALAPLHQCFNSLKQVKDHLKKELTEALNFVNICELVGDYVYVSDKDKAS